MFKKRFSKKSKGGDPYDFYVKKFFFEISIYIDRISLKNN